MVQRRLAERRTKGKTDVALLPLPTGAKNLHRLRRLFRYDIYRRYYADVPGTSDYVERLKPLIGANPRWFDDEVASLAGELSRTPHYVYGSRDKRYAVEAIPPLAAEVDDSAGAEGALQGHDASAKSAEPEPADAAPATTPEERRG